VEAVQVPSVLDCLDSSTWHRQAACRDSDVNFLPSEVELDRRWPGSPSLLEPLLTCVRCPVREECLSEALSSWRIDGSKDSISALGIWGATTTLERRAVQHLPVSNAVARLERGMPKRIQSHVDAFFAADHHLRRRHRTGRLIKPTGRARRVLELLAEVPIRCVGRPRSPIQPLPRVKGHESQRGDWASPEDLPGSRLGLTMQESGAMIPHVPSVTLINGVEMPILGFGVLQIPPDETEQAVATALEVGYRLVDTAAAYGNEEAVGRALRSSGIPRDQLFVATKLWIQNPGEANAKRAFEGSLGRLGLEHVDLYLIHHPLGDYYSFWRAMEQLYAGGRIRAIGVSNFYADRLVDLIEHNQVTPAVNQIETHPFFQRNADQELMRTHGVQMQAWGSFAEGRNNLFSDPTLSVIGNAHDKSVAQVVLRWLIQREIVAIPKSVRRDRMEQNLDVFDFSLTDDEMAKITTMDTGVSSFFDHRDPAKVSWLNGR
jgi:2,5-diketo-D-gluconate reductase A